ncbi:MAG TPA: phosphoglycerate dehydrogenase [Candidatus Xenobia bacterium]
MTASSQDTSTAVGRETWKVVVADGLPAEGLASLRDISNLVVKDKWAPDDLKRELADADALLVRSATKVTADLLSSAKKLRVVGRAGVGVDNIDVKACTARGIIVINSPEGNTVSAAEHTVALILSLVRHIPAAHQSLAGGGWKRNQYVGTELYKKAIGIVGLGKIGREVAARLRSFQCRILAYDPFLTEQVARDLDVEICDLNKLLEKADIVTLHLPFSAETNNLIGEAQLKRMKPGARLINCARGGLVDEAALDAALKSGHIAGAAVDVFTQEPPDMSLPLLKNDKVVVTPHLGASTEEAQMRVAIDVCEQLRDMMHGRPARSPVNFPTLPAEQMAVLQPFLSLAEKMGLLLSQTLDGTVQSVEILYSGEISKMKVAPVTNAALKGLLSPMMRETVNFVNAPHVAQERGIKVIESRSTEVRQYINLLSLKVTTDKVGKACEGTLFGSEPRIVTLDGYRVEIIPQGVKLLTWQQDRPGVVGRVGTLLGTLNVNIAEMLLGRARVREKAIMVLSLDDAMKPEDVDKIKALDGIEDVRIAHL